MRKYAQVNYHFECEVCGKKVRGFHGGVFMKPLCCGKEMKVVEGKLDKLEQCTFCRTLILKEKAHHPSHIGKSSNRRFEFVACSEEHAKKILDNCENYEKSGGRL